MPRTWGCDSCEVAGKCRIKGLIMIKYHRVWYAVQKGSMAVTRQVGGAVD